MRSPGIEPGSITWQATIITTRPRARRDKRAPEVRLELTTYRLTAGRATDCAIQELMLSCGGVAQMVERMLSMHEAQGSIPCSSTFLFFPSPLFIVFFFLFLQKTFAKCEKKTLRSLRQRTKRSALKHAQKVDSNHWDVNPPWI